MLVAEGAVDVSAEPEVSLWDLAALQVIIEEAGGTFTDLTGKPTPDGGSVVCTNGRLHAEVLDLLSRALRDSLGRRIPRQPIYWSPLHSQGCRRQPLRVLPCPVRSRMLARWLSQVHKQEGSERS